MEEKTKNLCAQIPLSLHDRVRRAQETAGLTLSQYVTDLITKFYEYEENGGKCIMSENFKTLAFQIPEPLKERLDRHIVAESKRTGKKISLKDFMVDLLTKTLDAAEAMTAAEAEAESKPAAEPEGEGEAKM